MKNYLDGYDHTGLRTEVTGTPIKPFSTRIMEEIERSETKGGTPRKESFVVIPQIDWHGNAYASIEVNPPIILHDDNLWQKMGNRTFYRLYGLNYFSGRKGDPETCGIQTAIKYANSKIFVKDATYSISATITQPKSNIFMEGEGSSASNDASYPNATFNGTILLASATIPAGTFNAPNYLILWGGNALLQAQGGGMKNFILGSAQGYNTGNIGGIALGFALKNQFSNLMFSPYNQPNTVNYGFNGPIFAFDATLSNPTQGGPTGGWTTLDEIITSYYCGGRETVRYDALNYSDTFWSRSIFFAKPFNNGIIHVKGGAEAVFFDRCLFYQVGANSLPAIQVDSGGTLNGLSVSNCGFEQNVNGGVANTTAFIYLNISADTQVLDGFNALNFTNNSYYIYSTISNPNAYVYDIEAVPSSTVVRIRGDQVRNDNAAAITYAKIVPTSGVWIDRPDFMKNVTHPFGFATTTPSVPSTGVAYTNTLGFRVKIYILTATGATYTITDPYNNTSASLTLSPGQAVDLDPSAKITPTYTTLTWKFYGW